MADTNENGRPVTIQAFITNPELNIDEVSAGIWHTFPTTAEELQKALATIRLDGVIHRRLLATPCVSMDGGFSAVLPETSNINEINYLAVRLTEINEDSRTVFAVAVQSGEFQTMRDIINVTENPDCFYLQPAYNAAAYGEFLSDRYAEYFADNINDLKNSNDENDREFAGYIEGLEACIDTEAYGMRRAKEENGHFTQTGYLTRTGAEFVEVYNTPHDIPNDCRVFSYPPAELIKEAISTASQATALCAGGKLKQGDLVLSSPEDEYSCMVGTVLKINKLGSREHDEETGNPTDDIHVDFTCVDYSPERKKEIESLFSELYGEDKAFADCPIDDVVMAPENLLCITGVSDEKLSAILASETGAADFYREAAGRGEHCEVKGSADHQADRQSVIDRLMQKKQQERQDAPLSQHDGSRNNDAR